MQRPLRLAALALCLLACPSLAAAETVQTGNSSAQVLKTIQFAVLLDMNFGKIAVNGPGVVELDPADGSRSCDPGLICTGNFALSELRLTGSDAAVKVTFDPTFELTGPGDPIVTEPLFPGGSGATVVIQNGEAVVKFGARLHINMAQAPGVYTGDFSVNLEYN
jgi:Domain of unknown function (DUF4402)